MWCFVQDAENKNIPPSTGDVGYTKFNRPNFINIIYIAKNKLSKFINEKKNFSNPKTELKSKIIKKSLFLKKMVLKKKK